MVGTSPREGLHTVTPYPMVHQVDPPTREEVLPPPSWDGLRNE
jgi:hypothetical protein